MTDFDRLLGLTSRTFGISIPLLDPPHRQHLTLSYLLFRVADTLEDAEFIAPSERCAALQRLQETLASLKVPTEPLWRGRLWSSHRGYQELLADFPALLEAIAGLDADVRSIIIGHAQRTVQGMLEYIGRSDENGRLQLRTLDELQGYCYVVAGIVGEMITDLLVDPSCSKLRELAGKFGEGLQLVNILRDASEDAEQGRVYLPATASRHDIFELARRDLDAAESYVSAVRCRKLSGGILPFVEFPLRLAQRTLDLVEQQGTGVKLPRSEVAELLLRVDDRFRSAAELPSRLRRV